MSLTVSSLNVEKQLSQKTWVTVPTFTTTTTSGTLALNGQSSTVHFITGDAAGFSVVLPDATTLPLGANFEVYNRASASITIRHYDGTTLGVLSPESVSSLILQSNTTQAGVFSPFSLEIAQAAGIANYNLDSQTAFSTSSATDVQIAGFTITPSAGEYFVSYNSSNVSTTNNAECTCSLYKNGALITGTERTARSTASNFILQLSTQGTSTFNGTDQLRVYVRTTTGTLTVNARNIIMLRLGSGG